MEQVINSKEIIFLLVILSRVSGEESLSKLIRENALKKYPALLYNDMDQYEWKHRNDSRRFSIHPYWPDIDKRPEKYTNWFRQLMTFAHDTAFYIKAGQPENKVMACYAIITTYTGAMHDLRRYYELRYSYMNSLDYEVGYMVHDIVWKYQKLVELFYLARKRYYRFRDKYKAPVQWMVYIYSNMLDMASAIKHLCGMLHETAGKYGVRFETGVGGAKAATGVVQGESAFEDYHLLRPQRYHKGIEKEREQAIENFNNQEKLAQKIKMKEFKKYLKKNPGVTPYTNKPYKSFWPLIYGWSIEKW